MRNITILAGSVLVLALGATSAFAQPSGDRIGQAAANSVAASGYTALAPVNADNAVQYTPLPLTNHGR